MSVTLTEPGMVTLAGDCGAEDAEALLVQLSVAACTVDWRECDSAHAAVVQVLIASRSTLVGPPRGEFLRRFVEPAIKAQ